MTIVVIDYCSFKLDLTICVVCSVCIVIHFNRAFSPWILIADYVLQSKFLTFLILFLILIWYSFYIYLWLQYCKFINNLLLLFLLVCISFLVFLWLSLLVVLMFHLSVQAWSILLDTHGIIWVAFVIFSKIVFPTKSPVTSSVFWIVVFR